jgi:hypothetical protein
MTLTPDPHQWKLWTFYLPRIPTLGGDGPTHGLQIAPEVNHLCPSQKSQIYKKWIFFSKHVGHHLYAYLIRYPYHILDSIFGDWLHKFLRFSKMITIFKKSSILIKATMMFFRKHLMYN